MHPPTIRRRPAYYSALMRQRNLAIAFRHAGFFRIFQDNDPLARVFRALNELYLRYSLATSPTHCRHSFLPLPQRERLLLCRFRALLLEYAKHGFALDRFEVVTSEEIPHRIQDIFVAALAYPFEKSRPKWKSRCRKALRVVAAYNLPKIEEAPFLFHIPSAEVSQLPRNPRPKRRQVAQPRSKKAHIHTPIQPSPTAATK